MEQVELKQLNAGDKIIYQTEQMQFEAQAEVIKTNGKTAYLSTGRILTYTDWFRRIEKAASKKQQQKEPKVMPKKQALKFPDFYPLLLTVINSEQKFESSEELYRHLVKKLGQEKCPTSDGMRDYCKRKGITLPVNPRFSRNRKPKPKPAPTPAPVKKPEQLPELEKLTAFMDKVREAKKTLQKYEQIKQILQEA